MTDDTTRRAFLRASVAVLGAGVAVPTALAAGRPTQEGERGRAAEEAIPATEDLMREHGVLRRTLLAYLEVARRLGAGEDVDLAVLADASGLMRSFAEDYHAKMEEEFLFPRFRKAGLHVDLVDVLQAQHEAGRRLTDRIRGLARAGAVREPDDRRRLGEDLLAFARMYAPHTAREETVVFPGVRALFGAQGFDALGEELERLERKQFGEDGFEQAVARVALVERALGIDDLARFTPREPA